MDQKRWLRLEVGPQCIGSGVCVGTAAEHFRLVDGQSQPITEDCEPDDLLTYVAEACPVQAISLRDKRTGALLAPEN
ncbi:MAG: ferredoxin [Kutzneria sp.]|nr:ferredoxin [Kutzneria sp.]MBV9844775.1 ferredoxin [Kutzneria sp.]